MRTLTFTLGGTFLFILLSSSLGKVFTDEEELTVELLKKVLRKLSDEEEKKSLDEEKRIIGGVELPEGEQKGLVYLEAKTPKKYFLGIPISWAYLNCAGSLINKRWILTSAHCFFNSEFGSEAGNPENWTARLGKVERKGGFFSSIFGWGKEEIQGEKIVINKGYTPNEHWLHDIALLKLEEEVPETDPNIAPVTLPAQGDHLYPSAGNTCVALGWGCTKKDGDMVDLARKVNLMVLSENQCLRIWGVSMDTRLCAGDQGEGKGICSGDAGGPLMCKRHNQWYQAGISSFTSSKDPGNVPSIFTRVSSYRNWIDSHTKE